MGRSPLNRLRQLAAVWIFILAGVSVLSGVLSGCGNRQSASADTAATDTAHMRHPLPDTLRVATLYSPGSYFIYRDQKMGYDYDMVSRLCRDRHMVLKLEVAPTLSAAIEMLDSGLVDLLAYEVPVTAEYKERVVPCGPENITSQVLVQPKVSRRGGAQPAITDVTELAGREVTVEKDSKYYHRLVNLNDEIGGGIIIRQVDPDSIITEDLIDLVSTDSIGLTVVDSDIARINQTYFPNLDITLEVSFPQRSRWAVSPSNAWLGDSIDVWIGQEKPRMEQAALLKRYFEISKSSGLGVGVEFSFKDGKASPYDDLFRRYGPKLGRDWRILAAIGFVESQFDPSVVSWAGARGMMQIMPSTARAYGVSPDQLVDNETSVATAVKVLQALDKVFAPKVKNPDERLKFIIAAYNSGHAHILDAIELARKYGYDPTLWDGNVATAMMLKSKPEYYNDPVVRYGYFRGRETFEFVRRVTAFYEKARHNVKP